MHDERSEPPTPWPSTTPTRSKADHNFDLTALARYTPYDNTKDIEFGLARKVRSPNLYERYTWSTAGMMMPS
jgi:iron complex outermembrane receptor protein